MKSYELFCFFAYFCFSGGQLLRPLVLIYYISVSCVFFTHLLKFYSGGAVDLWSCFVKSLEEAWKRKWEAEAEAVEGRLEEAEAEAKEKFTTVPSLLETFEGCDLLCLFTNWSSL